MPLLRPPRSLPPSPTLRAHEPRRRPRQICTLSALRCTLLPDPERPIVFLLTVALCFIPAFIYAAFLYWLDRFERDPKRLLIASFAWGAIVATTGALIGSLILQGGVAAFTGDNKLAEATGIMLIAPILEEIAKGLAVLLIFAIFKDEFDSILDGMIYAGVAALGFAATENVLYLYFMGYQENGTTGLVGLFFVRVILSAWLHPAFTALFGAGLAASRLSRNPWVKWGAPILGLAAAMLFHGLHNTMATVLGAYVSGLSTLAITFFVDWIGIAMVFALLLGALAEERAWMRRYLPEEVELGTITHAQLAIVCSLRAQFLARLRSRFARNALPTRDFLEACAHLAIKKHHLARVGDEGRNAASVARLRETIRARQS